MINLDHYDGAYGATIRIDTNELNNLSELRNVFTKLAIGEIHELDLTQNESVNSQNVSPFILCSVVDDNVQSKKLVRTGRSNESLEFVWSNSPSGWARLSGLIDGMIAAGYPCHQYLTREGLDDALVEVSYGENQ